MASASFDPRQVRLEDEKRRMDEINRDSDFVRTEPVDVLPGRAPERYRIKLMCKSIVGIDPASQEPVYGNEHSVLMYCDQEFPNQVPRLRWETPIWHPNVEHAKSKNVCVQAKEWLPAMGLDHLCRQLFDMAQFKNYHAEWKQPYPLDPEVAQWVRDYAEPRGIVDKQRGIALDDRPFYRPSANAERIRRIRVESGAEASRTSTRRIKIHGMTSDADQPSASATGTDGVPAKDSGRAGRRIKFRSS